MSFCVAVEDDPSNDLRQAIVDALGRFNADNGYPPDAQSLAITVRDEADRIVGGLWGKTVYGWLFVEFLILDAEIRGRDLGAQLMTMAEETAAGRGCVGAWLTTFSFQARGFYEKLGYS